MMSLKRCAINAVMITLIADLVDISIIREIRNSVKVEREDKF